MTNTLQNIEQTGQSIATQPTAISVVAGNGGVGIGTNYGSVSIYNNANSDVGQVLEFERNHSTQKCNVFVVKYEAFDRGCFLIPKNKVPAENLANENVCRYPSLFMDTNGASRRARQCANLEQQFFYGFITGMTTTGDKIKVSFQRLTNNILYKQDLYKVDLELGINANKGDDALNNTGWTILGVNLIQTLQNAGFNI